MPHKRPNRPSPFAEAALHKATWLRQRKHVDPDVAETIDALADAIVRMDEALRATESRVIRAVNRVESKLGQT